MLAPLQVSVVHRLPSSVQAVPFAFLLSAGHVLPAACVQRGLPTVPLHLSVVQTLPSSVHAVVFDLTTSVGQVVLVPLQVSVRSHSLTPARHTVPAFPAGCVHVALVPLQTSRVQ